MPNYGMVDKTHLRIPTDTIGDGKPQPLEIDAD